MRFLVGIWRIPRFRCNFSPPAAKKAKTKRFYTPPLGRKKRQSLFSPKKNLLARAKQFMFEVGAKIDVWPFYVQSRSQNRSVTILNLYMGGGGELTVFPPPSMFLPMSRPPPRPPSRPMWESMPIFSIFSEILGILEKFMNRTSEKSAFPYWNLVHSSISLQFSPPAAKKAKTKRFYTLLHRSKLKLLRTSSEIQFVKIGLRFSTIRK